MPAATADLRFDVFISYARKDGSSPAARLQRDLESSGLRVWRDTRDIDPAQDFSAEIEKAIEASDAVVVCVTPDVKREDSFVRREIGYSQACKRPIFVARQTEITPPIQIVNHTYADFFKGWEAAVALLKGWLARPDKPLIAESARDPYRAYLDDLYRELVESLRASVFSEETITLRAVESVGDVQRKTRRLNPKFITHTLRETPEPDPIPQHFDSLHAAYAHARCDSRVLLLGEPGAGKTTTLLAFARDAAAARLSDPTQPLPVFARIAGWDSSNQTPLTQWLADQNPGLTAPTLQSLIETGRALLLLDGLDELGSRRPNDPNDPSKGDYDPRERFLKALPPTGKLILSSRVEEYRAIGQQAALGCAVRLEPLDDPQMQAYLADVPDLWEVIAADASLKDALRTPLLLALVRVGFEDAPAEVRALRDLNAGDLNDRIWDAFIDQRWAHEQARQPDTPLPYTPDQLKQRLGRAVVQAMNTQDDYTRILANDPRGEEEEEEEEEEEGGKDVDVLISLAQRLDLLRPAGDEPVAEEGDSQPSYRFLHLRLRDALAFPVALAALRDPDAYVRSRAATALGEIGDARAVEPLLAALRDPKDWVRSSAAGALGKIGEPAVDPLIAALQDPDWDVRNSAAELLGRLSDPRAVEPLLAALQDPEWEVRSSAAYALDRLGDLRAIEPLIAALLNPEKWVRSSAAYALGKIGDARAVEPLIDALHDPDEDVRSRAAYALGKIGDARAVEPLIAALHDPDEDVRRRAATALAKLGEPAVEALIAALRDPVGNVSGHAAESLGKLGDARAVEPLIAALRDPEGRVRRSAADALGKIGDARAVEPLIAALRDPVGNVSGHAAEALGKIGDARAVEPLSTALHDPAEWVRRSAARALVKLGEPAVEPLIAALHDPAEWVRRSAADALVKLGEPAVEPLIDALQHRDWDVCRRAADALVKLGEPAVEPLIAALQDPDKDVRLSAAWALEKFPDHPAARQALADYRSGKLPPRTE